MADTIKCAFRSLFRNMERTLMTLIGISIGVASVITVIYIAQSGASAISGELDSLGMGGVTIGLSDYSTQDTLSDEELSIILANTAVESAAPLVFESASATMYSTTQDIYLFGIDYNAKDTISLELVEGRFLNQYDIRSKSQVCMVDESFLESMSLSSQSMVGKTLKISSGSTYLEYEIIGIIKTGSGILQNMMGSYLPNFIYIPYTTMQENLGSNNYSQIAVRLYDTENTDEIGEKLVSSLERSTGNYGIYTLTDLAQQKDNLNSILSVVTAILSAIGMISLIVAGISIMTIMLVSVSERKREIGIKKSIGADRHVIIKEFLCEAIVVSLVGCALGIVLGFALSYGITVFLGLTFQIRWDVMIYTIMCSILFGAVFGLYPAVKASKLKPVEALRMN